MPTIDVVIGANYGDEGKDLFVDYLANKYKEDCIVVRFNGGSQAGHTVISPEGGRHVFSHFGAGSMTNAKTYLSQYFISNPVLFKKEFGQIGEPDLKVYVHPDSIITTPYDMIINQFLERKRGNNRHGSCGAGINETMRRNKTIPFMVKDIESSKILDILNDIRNYHLYRILHLDLDEKAKQLINNPLVLKQFIDDLMFFIQNIIISKDILENEEHIIFEGAQGLLLDQDHEYFPHVTHSKTGLNNVKNIMDKISEYWEDDYNTNIYYISRGYMTRHGVGPFLSETVDELPYDSIYDKTNIHNEWQQSLRFGYLDLTLLKTSIYKDHDIGKLNIVVTCMDQLPDPFIIKENDEMIEISKQKFYEKLKNQYGSVWISEGETRKTITKLF